MALVGEVDQRSKAPLGHQDNVPSAPTVTAIRTAKRHVLLPAHGMGAGAASSCADLDVCLVYKFGHEWPLNKKPLPCLEGVFAEAFENCLKPPLGPEAGKGRKFSGFLYCALRNAPCP